MSGDDMVALRCKYCGAPLSADDVKGDGDYVTCPSCGTTQQRLDAKAYLDQMMAQVRSWIGKAVPGGMAVAGAQNVDPVARYNIWTQSVKPKIDIEYGEYRFSLTSFLSNPMLVMPFTVTTNVTPKHSTERLFQFAEQINGVSPLAVDEESQEYIRTAKGLTDAYAMLANNSKLFREDKPGRYLLMVNNFNTAAEDFRASKGYEPAADRFEGLSLACQGCERMLDGDITSAMGSFTAALTKLNKAKKDCITNMKVAIMGQAVATEISEVEALNETANAVNALGGDPLKSLSQVRRLFTAEYPNVGRWGSVLKDKNRLTEVFANMKAALASATGGQGIDIAAGPGNVLVPFWQVSLDYSFQTGSLWKKRAVEVKEVLLVSADFVIDSGCLERPAEAVTDVFAGASKSGFLDRLSGKEGSISNSAGIIDVVKSAAPNSIGTRKVVVPLSTRREAELIAENYVANVQNPQLKLSNPEVVRLIYVPFTLNGESFEPPGNLRLRPARVSRMKASELIILND